VELYAMKYRKNRRQNLGYLHSLFWETRALKFRIGNIEKEDDSYDPFKRQNSSQQITYKKLVKDTKDKKTTIDQCKDKIEEVRKISELLHLQSESRWNESDPVYYILSAKWLGMLKEYICYDYVLGWIQSAVKNKRPLTVSIRKLMETKHPGPINNSDILMDESEFFADWNDPSSYLNTPLKKNITRKDFLIVSKYLWNYLKAEYGLFYQTFKNEGPLSISEEQDYERQEIRRFTYFTADRKNIRRCQLPMIKLYVARRGKKLEDVQRFLILKQRATWEDIK
jgi:hypothetical protein